MNSTPIGRADDGAQISAPLRAIRELLHESQRKVVVLDDDPTGTQTVQGVPVLTAWDPDLLAQALAEPTPCFFILTNTRALPASAAAGLNRELARNLRTASKKVGREFTLISRSDSTLRGHFPTETDALLECLSHAVDATLLIPAFFEGGRVTVDGVHYVSEDQRLVPVNETEFARDATFGFRSANLSDWVEEKSAGRIAASSVARIALALVRGPGGAGAVKDALLAAPRGAVVTVDAMTYDDLEIFTHGLLLAEAHGRRYLARSAASFARVRSGLGGHCVLEPSRIVEPSPMGGLIVVGSYVAKTTRQLEAALTLAHVVPVEMAVDRLATREGREQEIRRVAADAEAALRAGRHAVVYTSRATDSVLGRAGELAVASTVSNAVVDAVRLLQVRPRFLIAKGGITSSDIATRALGIRRAMVLGQAAPGVPVWKTGPESRYPGLAYVIFPGNVGGPFALRDMLRAW